MNAPRFANILLSGPCNLRCPDCIGRQLGPARAPNLDLFPLRGLDAFVAELRARGIRQVSLSGTNTDPLLYRHQADLLRTLRCQIDGVAISLHSNGQLALAKAELVNRYDRVAISLPSFEPATCLTMTGRARPLQLERICERIQVPIKISVLLTEHNAREVPAMIQRCRRAGIRRMVLRTRFGDPRDFGVLDGLVPERSFAGNPVYDVDGLELTLWRFERARLDCVNLYSNGAIGRDYLLAGAEGGGRS